MDGRVRVIRERLDLNDFNDVPIFLTLLNMHQISTDHLEVLQILKMPTLTENHIK